MHVAQWSKEELVEEAVSTQGMKSQLTRQPHIKDLRGRSGWPIAKPEPSRGPGHAPGNF